MSNQFIVAAISLLGVGCLVFGHAPSKGTWFSPWLMRSVSPTGPPPPPPSGDLSGRPGAGLRSLQTLKGLSLAGRGVCFTQRDQLREALRDLQLSTLVSPGTHTGLTWFTLWLNLVRTLVSHGSHWCHPVHTLV